MSRKGFVSFDDSGTSSMKRSGSDPSLQVQEEEIVASKRSERKLKTFAAPSTIERRSESVLSAQALAEMHHLHEQWLKKERQQVDDTSEAAMQAAWRGGSWLAHGECPTTKEKPFHVRKCWCYPTTAEKLLAQWDGSYFNTKGQKSIGDTIIGQDNFSISELADDWQVICVMDGHGRNGHWPSTRAVRTVPFFLQTGSGLTMLKQGQPEAALINAFRKAEADLEYQAFKERVDIQVAGCTAACCCYHPRQGKVWVATAGDSRAMLVVPGKGAVHQTRDHKPSNPEEKARVEAKGCDVIITKYDDGWTEERINIRGQEYPGLSMSRCFGDLCVKDHGVTAEPVVVEWPVSQYKDPHIFVASDGVWEFMETETVAAVLLDSLASGLSHQQACKIVLQKARAAWQDAEGCYCDDITMVFMPLKGPRPQPRKLSLQSADGGCCAGITKSCAIC